MIVDNHYLLWLYGSMPREVGIYRRKIHYPWELKHYILNSNGVEDCYASIYPDGGVIDKIFFDFDGKNSLRDSRKLYRWLLDEEIPSIPVISGMKGYHIYVLLCPDLGTKEELTTATLGILRHAFGKEIKSKTPISVDFHCIGDIRRIARIPNTLRPPENKTWCSFLPRDFDTLDEEEILEYEKAPYVPRFDEYRVRQLPHLADIVGKYGQEIERVYYSRYITPENKAKQNNTVLKVGKSVIKLLFRPCIYRLLDMPNPPHLARVAATCELLERFDDEKIRDIFGTFGWMDWNPDYTLERIRAIRRAGYNPFSCGKLRVLGMCDQSCMTEKEVLA